MKEGSASSGLLQEVRGPGGRPWPHNNFQNLDLDKDFLNTMYDTGTHFKCYKTSLQDLENQQDCISEHLYFKIFPGKHDHKLP